MNRMYWITASEEISTQLSRYGAEMDHCCENTYLHGEKVVAIGCEDDSSGPVCRIAYCERCYSLEMNAETVGLDGLTDLEFDLSRQDDSERYLDLQQDEAFDRLYGDYIKASIEEYNEKVDEKNNRENPVKCKTGKQMQLSVKGGRWVTRGWRGAKFVKRMTNKAMRRMARRDPENAPTHSIFAGWIW